MLENFKFLERLSRKCCLIFHVATPIIWLLYPATLVPSFAKYSFDMHPKLVAPIIDP